MAEKRKGVTVEAPRGTGTETGYFEDGTDFAVIDSHLFIYAEGNRRIAVYAPGKWINAIVVV